MSKALTSIIIPCLMVLIFIPTIVSAVENVDSTTSAACTSGRFIPCDGTDACPCTFPKLMQLVSNALDFLVNVIAFPLAVVTFIYAGFLFMTSAINPGQRARAKGMMVKVVIGFAIILAANLIVKMVLNVLLDENIMNKVLFF